MRIVFLASALLLLTGCTSDPETDVAKCNVQHPNSSTRICMSSFGYDYKDENIEKCPLYGPQSEYWACYEKRGLYRSAKLLYVKK